LEYKWHYLKEGNLKLEEENAGHITKPLRSPLLSAHNAIRLKFPIESVQIADIIREKQLSL
tara:strand:- start:1159 stop:1341 length:183 start_codon:yes stop_codon:yes gene_type:complete